ncbi:MAG: hypothetical protein F2593_04285 [Actinobacteria bacterium]|nr:hypothetical protein [Actinomycetota bacterium]
MLGAKRSPVEVLNLSRLRMKSVNSLLVKKFFTLAEILKSLIAVALIALCLLASNWQWDKGAVATERNAIIKTNLTRTPLESLSGITDPISHQWLRVSITGHFISNKQTLVRNRYFQGVYGFEVLQLLQTIDGNIWINRGWVKAGDTAETAPVIPLIDTSESRILGRIRSEDLSRQLQGSFFALPQKNSAAIASASQYKESDFNFYLDLLDSENPKNAPLTPIELPDLSNGPHYAYAIQWLAFATLILLGRALLFRETQRLPLV